MDHSITPNSNDSTQNKSAWLSHLALIALLLYFGYVYRNVMFLTEGVVERDGFYHARYSQMLPERGLSRELRWMQFTEWKDRFCDKDFLYHVYLAAFTRDAAEPLPGAKYGTLILFLASLAALYFVSRHWKAPFPLLWVALLAVCSAHFLTRMFMVRSHCFSVLLMILSVHVILKRRFWLCFGMAFLYAWSYSVPLAMLIAACAAEAGRFVVERKWKESLRMPAATAAGLCAGLVIHPYTPNSLRSIWMFVEIIRAGAMGSDVELGSEFRHLQLGDAFTISIGSTAALLAALAAGIVLLTRGIKNRTLSPESAAALAVATGWFASMFLYSERLIEYAAPTACLACALVVRDVFKIEHPSPKPAAPARSVSMAVLGVAAIALAGLHAFTLDKAHWGSFFNSQPSLPKPPHQPTEDEIRAWHRGRFFDGASAWMKQNLKPGTAVANFHWDDFPELFYSAPEMNYLVGLDPTFMRLPYPDKSKALEDMRIKESPPGSVPAPHAPLDFGKLHSLFGTSFTILRRYRAEKYSELYDRGTRQFRTSAAGGKLVFEDAQAVIYALP